MTINRRALLQSGLAVTTASCTTPDALSPRERPNILWLVSEDNNPFIGAYGDPLAHTPTIDRLAREGVLFRHAYSNAPVCAPSRFAILTGMYPESCGPAHNMRAVAKLPTGFETYPELLRQAGYYCSNNEKTDYNCDVDPNAIWDTHGKTAHWRGRLSGQPFMAVFNDLTTHESRLFQPGEGHVTPDMVTIPPYLPDTDGMRQDYANYYNLMEKMDGNIAARLAELEADGLADDTIVFYYSDNGGVLPRSKRYCYDEGLRCALIVYAPPKWRHLLPAQPGQEIAHPVSLIDLPTTVCALAGARTGAQMQGKSFLGPSAAKQRYAFAGRNRMDERIDFQRTVTDGRWRYIRNYMPHRPWGQHQAFAWLAKGYQEWEAAHRAGTLNAAQDRFFQNKPFEELYDLTADPHQMRNLAAEDDASGVLRRLRKAMDAHMLAVRDNGFLPETMKGEGYMESRDDRAYPLSQVMDLAAAAARGDDADTPRLIATLADDAAVVRYWAATGLLIRGDRAASALPQMHMAMRGDPSPFVQIICAEAVAGMLASQQEPAEEAVALLAKLVADHPIWQVQLHALNSLTFLGETARSASPVIAQSALSDQEYIRSAGRYADAILDGSYTPATSIFDFEWLMRQPSQG